MRGKLAYDFYFIKDYMNRLLLQLLAVCEVMVIFQW